MAGWGQDTFRISRYFCPWRYRLFHRPEAPHHTVPNPPRQTWAEDSCCSLDHLVRPTTLAVLCPGLCVPLLLCGYILLQRTPGWLSCLPHRWVPGSDSEHVSPALRVNTYWEELLPCCITSVTPVQEFLDSLTTLYIQMYLQGQRSFLCQLQHPHCIHKQKHYRTNTSSEFNCYLHETETAIAKKDTTLYRKFKSTARLRSNLRLFFFYGLCIVGPTAPHRIKTTKHSKVKIFNDEVNMQLIYIYILYCWVS